MTRTRLYVESGRRALAADFSARADHALARDINEFVDTMPPASAESSMLAERLRSVRYWEGAPERSQ